MQRGTAIERHRKTPEKAISGAVDQQPELLNEIFGIAKGK
jgi:hypothetical protein